MKLLLGITRLFFTKERKFECVGLVVFLFFVATELEELVMWQISSKLIISARQHNFFFPKWNGLAYEHFSSYRNDSENSLKVVIQNSKRLSGPLCFHMFFNTARIFKVEI